MGAYNIAKMVAYKVSFTCQICYNSLWGKMYEYQAYSFTSRYKPEHFKKVCRDCVYKEVYGGNLWKKKKKEATLDDISIKY